MQRWLCVVVLTALLSCFSLRGVSAGSWEQISYQGPAPTARAYHTTVVDLKGRVFLFGGNTAEFALDLQNDLHSFDIESATWQSLTPWGTPPLPRFRHTAVFDEDSKSMIVFGGMYSPSPMDAPLYLGDVSFYHVEKNEWQADVTVSGTKPEARCYHVAVAKGGVMTIFGGNGARSFFNDVFKFQTASKRWTRISATGDIPVARSHASAVVYNNKMVLFGGLKWHGPEGYLNDVYTLDLGTNHWVKIDAGGSPPTRRVGHTAAMLGDFMYVFAGYEIEGLFVNDLFKLDMKAESWTDIPEDEAPRRRFSHTSLVAPDSTDSFLVFYGYADELVLPATYFNDVWKRQE